MLAIANSRAVMWTRLNQSLLADLGCVDVTHKVRFAEQYLYDVAPASAQAD